MEPVSTFHAVKLAVGELSRTDRKLFKAYLIGNKRKRPEASVLKKFFGAEVCRKVVNKINAQKLTGDGVDDLLSHACELVIEKKNQPKTTEGNNGR